MSPAGPARLLIADSDAGEMFSLRRVFERSGYHLIEARSGREALEAARDDRPDAILFDASLGGGEGMPLLREIRAADARVPVVAMMAYTTAQNTVEALLGGAYDLVQKPFNVERLRVSVKAALSASRAMREPVALGGAPTGEGARLVGDSAEMRTLLKAAAKMAAANKAVLIAGEEGTGKRLLARAVYQRGNRAKELLFAVDCGQVDADVFDEEMFGVRRGVGGGAGLGRPGRVRACAGGTLLLARVDRLPTALREKVIRLALHGETVMRGTAEAANADVRVIMTAEVARGNGKRLDACPEIAEALSGQTLFLPALLARRGDIPALADYIAARISVASGKPPAILAPDVAALLKGREWPRNVRDLEEAVARAVGASKGGAVTTADFEFGGGEAAATPSQSQGAEPLADPSLFDALFSEIARRQPLPAGYDAFDVVERHLIDRALDYWDGNQSRAARFLGITRNTLRKRIRKYGLGEE